MVVTVSAVVLLGIIVFILLRGGFVRAWPALACTGFGYFLTSTGAAPVIADVISTVTGWIPSISNRRLSTPQELRCPSPTTPARSAAVPQRCRSPLSVQAAAGFAARTEQMLTTAVGPDSVPLRPRPP
ncbi:hypothetical protein ACF063_41085 [Streptomyces chartreusis]|uniref:hypothetical protein n=1 Tax=Streptomyces chartreusis TaxID=1969 RepID=UPI0036FD94D0